MIRRISERIVAFLDQRGALKHSSKEVYIYGFDIAIYTYLSTIGLFLVGWAGGYPLESILLIALYYTNQSIGGGYHASTHMRCFLTMLLGMLFFLIYMSLPYSYTYQIIIAISALFALWKLPLVLHSNKRHLYKRATEFIKESHRLVVIQAFILILICPLRCPQSIIQTISCAYTLSAFSRIIAWNQYRRASLSNQ